MKGNLLVTGAIQNIHWPQKPGDVGYDLAVDKDYEVGVGQLVYMSTGVFVKIPDGYWGRICGRSSTMKKLGVLITEGVIDTNYTGELFLGAYGLLGLQAHPNGVVKIPKGSRICQLILIPAAVFPIQAVEALPETERGETGFGSTGQ